MTKKKPSYRRQALVVFVLFPPIFLFHRIHLVWHDEKNAFLNFKRKSERKEEKEGKNLFFLFAPTVMLASTSLGSSFFLLLFAFQRPLLLSSLLSTLLSSLHGRGCSLFFCLCPSVYTVGLFLTS